MQSRGERHSDRFLQALDLLNSFCNIDYNGTFLPYCIVSLVFRAIYASFIVVKVSSRYKRTRTVFSESLLCILLLQFKHHERSCGNKGRI